jgi:hypothetical protein
LPPEPFVEPGADVLIKRLLDHGIQRARGTASGALLPPQRKDRRGLSLACNQSHDATGPRASPATGCEMPAPAGQTDKVTGAARGPSTSWEGRSVLSREPVRGGQAARLLGF